MSLAIHSGDEARIREEICSTGASLYQRGYTVGSAGNISARLDDGWLITPTDACLGRLDPAEIAKVDLAGNAVSGGKPSKTLALHRGIYARNAQTRGIVQNIYIFRTEKHNGTYVNEKIATLPMIKENGQP